jgi:hypothetical protein
VNGRERCPACHPEPLAVILSAAKDLCVRRARLFPFAALRASADALRVTGCKSPNETGGSSRIILANGETLFEARR